jgi:hypothetical protein
MVWVTHAQADLRRSTPVKREFQTTTTIALAAPMLSMNAPTVRRKRTIVQEGEERRINALTGCRQKTNARVADVREAIRKAGTLILTHVLFFLWTRRHQRNE